MSFRLVKAGCKPNEFHSPWQRLGDLIMHALKGQQRPAQGKRSDTLGLRITIELTPCKGKSIQCWKEV